MVMSYDITINTGKIKKTVIAVIVIGVVAVLFANAIQIVPAGYRGILLHWSAVDTSNSMNEGLHFVVPFQDQIVPLEVRTLKYEAEATGASKDLQDVRTKVAVNYRVDPNLVHILYKEIGPAYESRIIQPAIFETVKQVTAKYNAAELVTERPLVKSDIESQIKVRLANYNLVSDQISITDFAFSPEFTQSIEQKVVAEQNAQKAVNDLQRIRVEAEQAQAHAIGEANANIAKADGEAKAIAIINDALANNPNYLEWLKTQKWNGELPKVIGGAVPFVEIPMEQSP
jgi:prohibitin 2